MSETTLQTRVISKHDFDANWINSSFVPAKGEIIIYDAEVDSSGNIFPDALVSGSLPDGRTDPYRYERIKVGDGTSLPKDLKFESPVIHGIPEGSAMSGGDNSVGCKGFIIKNIEPKGYSAGTTEIRLTLNEIDGLAINDVCSIRVGGNYIDFGKITAIDVSAKTVTVDNYPVDLTAAQCNNLSKSSQFWIGRKQDIGTDIFDSYQHAEGQGNKALMYAAHAEGYYTTAAGRFGHSEGNGTYAGYAAHAEGLDTLATGRQSHAEGAQTKATSDGCHAEGYNTTASNQYSHAEGYNSVADGTKSHAEGYNSHAEGEASHAEGTDTHASATASHAEGASCQATGYCSHAGGRGSIAGGESSFAHGHACKTHADNTVAIGYRAEATEDKQIVLGSFNSKVDGKFLLGIGESDSSLKNGLRVDDYGNLFIKGGVYYGCNDDCTSVEDGHSVDDIYHVMSDIQTNGVSQAEFALTADNAGIADFAFTADTAGKLTNIAFKQSYDNKVFSKYALAHPDYNHYDEDMNCVYISYTDARSGRPATGHIQDYSPYGDGTVMGYKQLVLCPDGKLFSASASQNSVVGDVYLTDESFEEYAFTSSTYTAPPDPEPEQPEFHGVYLSTVINQLLKTEDADAYYAQKWHSHTDYVEKTYVDNQISSTKTYVDNQISSTKTYVDQAIASKITTVINATYKVQK